MSSYQSSRQTRRASWANSTRPSRITVPQKAHPLARLVFAELRRQRVTYPELEHRAGVLISTFKSWRCEKMPGLTTIEAALGALGWNLVPVPDPNTLPAEVRTAISELSLLFRDEDEIIGTAIAAAAAWPVETRRQMAEMRNRRATQHQPEGIAA